MEQERDLTRAVEVYRSDGYPGARWYVMSDDEVVLQRPSGELDQTIMTPEALASASSRPASVWYLETPRAEQG